MIQYYNEDCMEGMKRYKNKHFDLAIVDPPYGIGVNKMNMGRRKGERKKYIEKDWDNAIPDKTYFEELFRVSQNQIIWGGNYMIEHLYPSRGWVFWDKEVPLGVSFSDGELAWTSFDRALKKARIPYSGFRGDEGKIHPTQKPVKLYKWLLRNYAKKGDLILDTHVGSASSLIACYDMGFDAVGFELDKDYYEASKKRLNDFMAQGRFF